MNSFEESFWNKELCNFIGFETLCRKLKDGRQTCKDYLDFLKQRAQAQEVYGKTLVRLARFNGAKDEIGTLRQSWEVLCNRMGTVGLLHVQTAGMIMEEVNRVNDLVEAQKEQKRKAEETVRRHQLTLKTLLKNLKEHRRSYEARCKEESYLTQQLDNDHLQPREAERVNSKADKARAQADQAEVAYRIAVESVEQARKDWERDTRSACELFEDMERQRIEFLRNSMWVITNIGSDNCVKEDGVYEEMRKVLERCDIDKDLRLFVHLKKTGNEPPPSLQYFPYSEEEGVPDPTLCSDNPSRLPASPTRSITPLSSTEIDIPRLVVNDDVYALPIKTSETNDGLEEHASLQINKGKVYIAMYAHQGEDANELSLCSGQEVSVVKEDSSGWWTVMTSLGTTGFFPAAYLKPK